MPCCPNNPKQDENLLYVDSAVRYLYRKMIEYGGETDMVVKLFGGARCWLAAIMTEARKTVGEQNIIQAEKMLERAWACRLPRPISAGRRDENCFFP